MALELYGKTVSSRLLLGTARYPSPDVLEAAVQRAQPAMLTASLRRRYPADRYVGIELELNQALMVEGEQRWQDIRALMVASLKAALR